LSTVIQEKYAKSSFTKPTMVYGDGDGTVPVESLTYCKNWITEKRLSLPPPPPFFYILFLFYILFVLFYYFILGIGGTQIYATKIF
jgi:Lecithin:cholesterol acyltransferase